jgi:hypothetical protein
MRLATRLRYVGAEGAFFPDRVVPSARPRRAVSGGRVITEPLLGLGVVRGPLELDDHGGLVAEDQAS